MMPSNSVQIHQNLGQKAEISNKENSGKLNHNVVKPIGAAHSEGEVIAAILLLPIAIVAIPVLLALSIAFAFAPVALVAGGIYLACTGGAPLAVAGLICGGVALAMLQGGGAAVASRK